MGCTNGETESASSKKERSCTSRAQTLWLEGTCNASYSNSQSHLELSVVTLDKCIRNFSRFTGCSLGEAIKCATYNPAKCVCYLAFQPQTQTANIQGVWVSRTSRGLYDRVPMLTWLSLTSGDMFVALGFEEGRSGTSRKQRRPIPFYAPIRNKMLFVYSTTEFICP